MFCSKYFGLIVVVLIDYDVVPGRRASRGNIPDSSRGISTSTEDEAAARHAAMVVSAANTQTGGVTSSGSVGGGGATDALDESVDERQMREGTNVENAGEVKTVSDSFFNTIPDLAELITILIFLAD